MTGMLYKKLTIIVFLVLVFGATVATWGKLEEDSQRTFDPQAILSGKFARDFEQRYDRGFSLRQVGLNVWMAVQYLMFNEAKKGLLIGSNGWLFSDEEFIVAADGEQALKANLTFIEQASEQLANQGVELIVVLIPSKARLLTSQTGRHNPTSLHRQMYSQVINRLSKNSIFTLDGLQEMRAYGQPESLYLKTDTHWTPRGAELLASRTAALFYRQLSQLSLNQQAFITEAVGVDSLQGDLLRFLPLAPLFSDLLPAAEYIDIYQTYPAGDDFDAFISSAEKPQQVVLLGTSFSADRRWNFDGALKQALAVDVQNLAVMGQGPIEPMVNFLNNYLSAAKDLKLVVWEIPERYLPVAYPQAYSQIDL